MRDSSDLVYVLARFMFHTDASASTVNTATTSNTHRNEFHIFFNASRSRCLPLLTVLLTNVATLAPGEPGAIGGAAVAPVGADLVSLMRRLCHTQHVRKKCSAISTISFRCGTRLKPRVMRMRFCQCIVNPTMPRRARAQQDQSDTQSTAAPAPPTSSDDAPSSDDNAAPQATAEGGRAETQETQAAQQKHKGKRKPATQTVADIEKEQPEWTRAFTRVVSAATYDDDDEKEVAEAGEKEQKQKTSAVDVGEKKKDKIEQDFPVRIVPKPGTEAFSSSEAIYAE